jgi:hypothetical protein
VEDVVTVTNQRGIFAAGSIDSGDARVGDVVERASRPRGAGTGKSAAGRRRPALVERAPFKKVLRVLAHRRADLLRRQR